VRRGSGGSVWAGLILVTIIHVSKR
jgi:hypothetical protein